MNLKIFYIAVLVLGILISCSNPSKSYVFVIDTSGSMTYQDKTIHKVKKQMPDLLNLVKTGDSVTLIEFDDEPRIGKTIQIESEETKEQILREIQDIEAEGQYTDMYKLIQTLQKWSEENSDEKAFIVVLSDGLDDPSPGSKNRETVNLKQYAAETPGPVNDYYIYYLSLGKTKSVVLEEGLKTVSPRVKTLERKADDKKEASKDGAAQGQGEAVGTVGESANLPIDEIASDINKQNILFSIKDNKYILFAAAGAVLAGIIFLLIILFKKNKKLVGSLIYKPQGSGHVSSIYNLKKIETGKLVIGSKRGNNLRISDLGIPREITLVPIKTGGLDFLRPVGKSSSLIEFLEQKTKGRISFGDKFRIGNYIFEYSNGKEN